MGPYILGPGSKWYTPDLAMRQVFAPHDIVVVLVLMGLEALLSIDNCVVLTVLVQHLPMDQRKKALMYGVGGAFVFRFIFVLLATTLMSYWWIQAIGSSYLLYITYKHFRGASDDTVESKPRSLLQTIIAVEITDVCFAGDSVMAGVAMIKGAPEKLWVVYLGGILGIFILRIAISMLTKVVDRWPGLVHVGYGFVAWVGVRLMLVALNKFTVNLGNPNPVPVMSDLVFWSGMVLVGTVGTYVALKVLPSSVLTEPSVSQELQDELVGDDLTSATTV